MSGTLSHAPAASARPPLGEAALDTLFRAARSHNAWQPRGVSDEQLLAIWDLAKWGPTSANCQPMRVLFLRSEAAKLRLAPHLVPGNLEKTMRAPVTAILGFDMRFYDLLPRLFPHNPSARSWFSGEPNRALAEATAFRNGTLQGAYFMLAARALGLDCGPMSGFQGKAVDREFWAGKTVKTDFLCNLGYGDPRGIFPRSPPLAFSEACAIL